MNWPPIGIALAMASAACDNLKTNHNLTSWTLTGLSYGIETTTEILLRLPRPVGRAHEPRLYLVHLRLQGIHLVDLRTQPSLKLAQASNHTCAT